MFSLLEDDFALLKQALIFTCTMQAVNQIVEHKDGSAMTVLVTAVLLTFGAKMMKIEIQRLKWGVKTPMLIPIYSAGYFVAETLVSVGINFQANLIGSYLGNLFNHNTPPLYILFGTFNALLLVWILGVAIGVIDLKTA